ncbi:antitoxin [Leptospira wolffii]|uniref:antitoxin n=1 Tax=Leptospira wolffii TaxID=409998 RepID=UPI001082CA65|nr:antitoxin [Leptospira wolffii]TGL47394.1 antitoxin [Leptospira wolffii]
MKRKNISSVTKSTSMSKEEQDILNSFEAGEWVPISPSDKKKKLELYKKAASKTLSKNKRINIRLNQIDLDSIQRRAFEEGLPYQTLISSLIHKFVTGKLVEK